MNIWFSLLLLATTVLNENARAWMCRPVIGRRDMVVGSSAHPGSQLRTRSGAMVYQSTSISDESEEGPSAAVSPSVEFTEDELKTVEDLYEQSGDDLEKAVLEALQSLSPRLIVKLRQSENHEVESIRKVAAQLENILEAKLNEAKVTLKELLDAGEIRKLDSLIGKAAREDRLDVAFFNVLSLNIQDAAAINDTPQEEGAASRLQILQHIHTRCQEEVEKTIPPGVALLNKLLRTEQPQIRSNLYKHYLTPQPNVIKSPDGKEVELKGTTKQILVPLNEFVNAVAKLVEQIRTVENAGGTDRESAAAMVESCRQVAKEARIVIGEAYGVPSDELKSFEQGLQPVFRPESRDSPYIKGQT